MTKRPREFAGLVLGVLSLTSCAWFPPAQLIETQTASAQAAIDQLVASGELPSDVTIVEVSYQQSMTDHEEVTVRVAVPATASLAAVNESIVHALWLSEVTPLSTVVLLERAPTKFERGTYDPQTGILDDGDNFSISWDSGAADGRYESFTERWGGRPVDG